jgi:hypothetical protein
VPGTAEGHELASVTVTLYVPEFAVDALPITGSWVVDEKPGPAHE